MKNTNIVRMTIILVVMIMMLTSLTACAQGEDHAKLIISLGFDNVILRNGEDKYLEFFEPVEDYEESEIKGNMQIYKDDSYVEDEDNGEDYPDRWLLEIPDSESFIIEPIEKDGLIEEQTEFKMKNRNNKDTMVFADYFKKITINKNIVQIIGEEESTFEYKVMQLLAHGKSEAYYSVAGRTVGSLMYKPIKRGVVLKGAKGKTNIVVFAEGEGKTFGGGLYYLFGEKVKVYNNDGRIIVSPAPRIPERETKRVTSLYLRPVNDGKNMFLTWNKVKKAKSYIVYKYDYAKRKYKRVAVRGRNANYLNIGHADPSEKYRYKVAAMSKAKGKGKKVCKRSYPVWAVAQENAYGNASKVTTNMSEIKGKAGKAYRLKAAVSSKGDKTLLSDNIRWYCSNHKVATIDKKTGKVKLKKKGKCRIWAKAHNGKNSRQILVTVK